MTNCPNCGAVITGNECEYCGTVFRRSPDIVDLHLENELLCQQIQLKSLYEEALRAMRLYSERSVFR